MDNSTVKACTKCKQEKLLYEFYRDKYGKFGRCAQCIECSYSPHPDVKTVKETKICTQCKIEKPLTEFYTRQNVRDGRASMCAECQREKTRVYREGTEKLPCTMCKINPKIPGRGQKYCEDCKAIPKNHTDRALNRQYQRKSKFGLTLEDLIDLLKFQNGVCVICDNPITVETLHIDHDHACCPDKRKTCGNCVRGLLCGPCNTSLGKFRDSVEVLQVAINYLQNPIFNLWKEDLNGR